MSSLWTKALPSWKTCLNCAISSSSRNKNLHLYECARMFPALHCTWAEKKAIIIRFTPTQQQQCNAMEVHNILAKEQEARTRNYGKSPWMSARWWRWYHGDEKYKWLEFPEAMRRRKEEKEVVPFTHLAALPRSIILRDNPHLTSTWSRMSVVRIRILK